MQVVVALDEPIYQGLRAIRTPGLDAVMRLLTFLGDNFLLLMVVLAASLLLWRRGRLSSAVILVLAAVLGMALVEGLKELVQRPRPEFLPGFWDPSRPSYAFPSGHAFNSTAVYLMTALMLGSRRWLLVAMLVAGLIGLTRLVLGVHWLTDVLGGWALGAAWALAWVWCDWRLRGRS